jgi:hypothetical protein
MLVVYLNTSNNNHTFTLPRRATWLIFLKIFNKLAQSLRDKICANLINFIKEIIFSATFLEQHRQKKTDFTRSRLLPFTSLVLYLCNFTKSSYQSELNKFFKIITGSTVARHVVSKVALCKARKKLKYEAFVELNDQAAGYFYQHFNPLTWNGFFLKAIDGSTVKLPNFPEIVEHFGTWGVRQGDPVPMARISQMFDPLNRITTHALIKPKGIGEREMAASHFEQLSELDLVLLDRGYPAFWLFKLILSRGAQFCSRISSKKWKIVRKFVESGQLEQIIYLVPPVTSKKACRDYGLDLQPMRLRLIRIELSSGEVEVLITSLTDCRQYPYHLFEELYHDRWPVEEDYKVMKCRIELENFSGQTELSVYQDFHSKVFSKNITSMIAFAARDRVEEATVNRENRYKINFTQALSTMRDTIVVILQKATSEIGSIISDILETFAMAIEPVRPGRKYPRNHKRAQRKYCLNYKPIL